MARKLNKKVRSGEISEAVYTLSVEIQDQLSRTLKLQVDQTSTVDPPYTTLTIRLRYETTESLSQKKARPIKTEWEIN
jgi:hypothetical protein